MAKPFLGIDWMPGIFRVGVTWVPVDRVLRIQWVPPGTRVVYGNPFDAADPDRTEPVSEHIAVTTSDGEVFAEDDPGATAAEIAWRFSLAVRGEAP